MIKPKFIEMDKEYGLIHKVGTGLVQAGYNGVNSIVVTVGVQFSSIAGQVLSHTLISNNELPMGFGIRTPKDESGWDSKYHNDMIRGFKSLSDEVGNKNIILVQCVNVHGLYFKYIADGIRNWLGINNKIVTVCLFENIGSDWESDFVGEYYDNQFDDLRFWWDGTKKNTL